jgi:hypothetical protein
MPILAPPSLECLDGVLTAHQSLAYRNNANGVIGKTGVSMKEWLEGFASAIALFVGRANNIADYSA